MVSLKLIVVLLLFFLVSFGNLRCAEISQNNNIFKRANHHFLFEPFDFRLPQPRHIAQKYAIIGSEIALPGIGEAGFRNGGPRASDFQRARGIALRWNRARRRSARARDARKSVGKLLGCGHL